MGTFLRYYIYLKDRPDKIIGAINFNIFRTSREPYAEIGTKKSGLSMIYYFVVKCICGCMTGFAMYLLLV